MDSKKIIGSSDWLIKVKMCGYKRPVKYKQG